MSAQIKRRETWSWAFYDWANSAFATAIIAGFFPVFFKQFWSAGADVTVSTFRLGVANSVTSLVVLSFAPLLGAIADQGGLKKPFLTAFAMFGVLGTAGLFFVGEGHWQGAVILYVATGIGFAGANIFYDALIVNVAGERNLEFVSGLGFAMGYLGGGLFFGFCVAMTLWPGIVGLDESGQAVRWSFLLTAAWWSVFSVPLLLWVREGAGAKVRGLGQAVNAGFRQVISTFHKIRRYRTVWLFLLAYWLYIDGVDTIIRMAVDYGMSLGFSAEQLVGALLLTQFVAFPATLGFAWAGQRMGPKRGILIGLCVYMGITYWSYRLAHVWEFYAIACAIGLVQGGVQSLSRSLYARLIPAEAAGEFFGFYNLLGKFAAVIGPFLMGYVGVVSGDSRVSVLSLLGLFVVGALLLIFVDAGNAVRDAE